MKGLCQPEPRHAALRSWTTRVALLLALATRTAGAEPATMRCSVDSYATLSPAPARITLPAATRSGAPLWSGLLTLGFSCSSSRTGATIMRARLLGGSTAKALRSSRGAPAGVSIVSSGAPYIALTAAGCALDRLRERSAVWSFGLIATASGRCAGTLDAPVELIRGHHTPGRDIAASLPTGDTRRDWIVAPTRAPSTTTPVGLDAPIALREGAGCTVSPIGSTVVLPTLSTSALRRPGERAGATRFTLPLQSCRAVAHATYAVYATWSYTAVPGYPTVIRNSAAAGASNVGVEIIGPNGTAAPSGGGGTSLAGTVDASGAVAPQVYLAQYAATGPVTPGAVSAVATFTLTYQ